MPRKKLYLCKRYVFKRMFTHTQKNYNVRSNHETKTQQTKANLSQKSGITAPGGIGKA